MSKRNKKILKNDYFLAHLDPFLSKNGGFGQKIAYFFNFMIFTTTKIVKPMQSVYFKKYTIPLLKPYM